MRRGIPTGELRIILLFDVWRLELTETERRAISTIFDAIDSFQTLPARLRSARSAAMLKPVATDIEALKILDERLRWLSAWTIHHANHVRESADGLKVGGHQASCASMTAIMAALYFHALGPNDRVAVKPHAGPVLHAIHYLLGTQIARGAGEFPRLRRRAILSEPDQGQDPGRLLDRLGRPRRRDHALRQPRAGLSHRARLAGRAGPRPLRRADRRCRARRRQYLRSDHRGRQARRPQPVVDRRLQPPEPRRDQRRPHVRAVRRDLPQLRLARGRAALRQEAAGRARRASER